MRIALRAAQEIERAKELLQEEARRFCGKDQQMVVFPLYAGLPPVMQLQALTAAPRGARKARARRWGSAWERTAGDLSRDFRAKRFELRCNAATNPGRRA